MATLAVADTRDRPFCKKKLVILGIAIYLRKIVAAATVWARKNIKRPPFPAFSTQSSQLASTDRRHHGQTHPLLLGKNTSRGVSKRSNFFPHIHPIWEEPFRDFLKITRYCLLQGSAKRWTPGLVNFVPAVAYHFCLALPAAFTQPGAHMLTEPCISETG